jgi:hypothetical protein
MPGRIITLAMIIAAGYWYWSGPYQSRQNPDYQQKLEANAEKMRECIRARNYKLGATGVSEGDPEQVCAKKLNLYRHDGQWHSYDDVREGR